MKTRVDSSFGRGQDNEKTFDLRMKNPKDLKKLAQLGWDKNKIEYQYNSVGFRSIEFEEPHDAIACFGCSHTEGEGVRAEYRWSNIVAKTIKNTLTRIFVLEARHASLRGGGAVEVGLALQ